MLTVNDLMTVDPICVTPQMSVADVCELLDQEEVRQLPVVELDEVVGIVTERDISAKAEKGQRAHISVEAVMTPNPICVLPDMPAFRAAEMLRTFKFGALPVVDQGRLVGIISVSDFLSEMVFKSGAKGQRTSYDVIAVA